MFKVDKAQNVRNIRENILIAKMKQVSGDVSMTVSDFLQVFSVGMFQIQFQASSKYMLPKEFQRYLKIKELREKIKEAEQRISISKNKERSMLVNTKENSKIIKALPNFPVIEFSFQISRKSTFKSHWILEIPN